MGRLKITGAALARGGKNERQVRGEREVSFFSLPFSPRCEWTGRGGVPCPPQVARTFDVVQYVAPPDLMDR